MKPTLLRRTLLVGIAAHIFRSSGWAASPEEVILKDGTYKVLTENGMPVPFKSREIEIMGLGPLFSGKTAMGF